MTLRDRAWNIILLSQIARVENFKRKDLGFSEEERHTVQRVLNEMEARGWVERKRPQSGIWYPGVLSKHYFGNDYDFTVAEMEELEERLQSIAEETGTPIEELLSYGCRSNNYPDGYDFINRSD